MLHELVIKRMKPIHNVDGRYADIFCNGNWLQVQSYNERLTLEEKDHTHGVDRVAPITRATPIFSVEEWFTTFATQHILSFYNMGK